MSKDLFQVSLTTEPLQEPAFPGSSAWGSVLVFGGVVRGSEEGREISGIHYSCYFPMAERMLVRLAEEGQEQFTRHRLELRHRIGFVAAGETSLLLVVASPHSREGFEMSRWYLDQVKTRVPIWKEPRFADAPEPRPVTPTA